MHHSFQNEHNELTGELRIMREEGTELILFNAQGDKQQDEGFL